MHFPLSLSLSFPLSPITSPRTDKKSVDLSKPMKMGAFVDFNRTRKYSEDDYILPETPPFSWLLRKTPQQQEGDANNNSESAPPATAAEETTTAIAACNKENNHENSQLSEGENKNNQQQQHNSSTTTTTAGSDRQGKRSSVVEAAAALLLNQSSQRPSRWSVSPTLDEEKFLKELVGGTLRVATANYMMNNIRSQYAFHSSSVHE